ncbi:MAG: hypothetical protein GY714_18315 [Desulfobacterales bacterium]|nr:hypothetical protein [Desulfobacterales bacterium]
MIKYILMKWFGYNYWYRVKLQYICNNSKIFYQEMQIGFTKKNDILDGEGIKKYFFSESNVFENNSLDDYHMGIWHVEVQCYLGFLKKGEINE